MTPNADYEDGPDYVIRDRYTGVIVGCPGPIPPEVAAEIRRHLVRIFPGKVIFAVVDGVDSVAFTVELPEGSYVPPNDRGEL